MTTSKNNILIIIPYFGKAPWYFDYFIHSCRYNPAIDFLLITDHLPTVEMPENILVIHKTFEDTKKLIAHRLNMEVNIPDPYKLCDFKPAYGFIFSAYTTGYLFWGCGDIDVIYGNIKNFITDEVLETNDVISIRPEYITGFFCLYRNSEKINSLFKLSKDHQIIFQTEKYLGFDECALLCDELMEGEDLFNLPASIESITHIVKKLAAENYLNAYFDFHVVERTPGNLRWKEGELFYLDKYEVLLYHLVRFKVHPVLKIPSWDKIPADFMINEFSFSGITG